MTKWIGGIVASIIAGVSVYYLTRPAPQPPPPPPPPPLSFLETIQGSYRLRTWNEANRPVTMGVKVSDGTLAIDSSGNADWNLGIWSSASHPQGPPPGNNSRIKCGGSVVSSSQEIRWVPGGARNVAMDWSQNISSVRDMVWPAFCGGHVTGTDAPFALHLEQPSAGAATLEMRNSEGVFVWEKT